MVTLIGHGYIGKAIAKELEEQGIEFRWLSHAEQLNQDGVIINAAGFTGIPNVDACEIYKQETIDGNVLFPLKLEQDSFYPIIHITSGCVYTGYKEDGWTEEDEPNFNFNNGSFYSGSKALAQKVLEREMDINGSYLLRIRMPFSSEETSKNLLTKLERYDKLIDFENSLSNVEEVAKVVVHFTKTLPEPGIYNVCNPGGITTKEIADMMGLQKEWFTEEEFKAVTKAPRSNCVLNTDKLSKIYQMTPVKESLEKTIKKYEKNKRN